MIPTVTGFLICLIGAYLLFRPRIEMLAFTCVCTLLPAASAIDLPALGQSSIPPAMLSLAFLAAQVIVSGAWRAPELGLAVTKNSWLILYCLYCAATALVLPRLFAGLINLIPMGQAGLGFVPLRVTAQNTTQAIYILGTGFAAVCATLFSTQKKSPALIVATLVVVTWIHALTGALDLAFNALHIQGAFDFARTGAYAQLNQGVGGFHRISALCSEPSVYATLGATYFVFMCELWLRGVSPGRTGPAALVMLVMLALSTSSTAYIFIPCYGAILLARAAAVRGALGARQAGLILGLAVCGLVIVLTVAVLKPRLAADIATTVAELTIGKAQSESGIERGLWAKQGLDAMVATHGLGVGVGSFRSSSLVTAILGSVGPAGLIVLIGYCAQVAKLGRRSSYASRVDRRVGAGAAAGWTALMTLAPAALSWPSADPGLLFALMAGLSLGWRSPAAAAPAVEPAALKPISAS
jgi:hypothetical protein